jgi:hypothetical protein
LRWWPYGLLLILALPFCGWAQGTTTFRSQSTVVLVPALVLDEKDNVVYGLTAEDFMIKDNGAEQTVHLDETLDSKPVSVVVAVQTSGRPAEILDGNCKRNPVDDPFPRKVIACTSPLRGVALMLEPFLQAPGSEMAIVSVDSQVKLRRGFTSDTAALAKELRDLPEGDSENATLDALRFSIDLLEHRPKEHRRVLVLISELRDHGSTTVTFDEIARRIIAMDAEFYAIAFSGNAASELADLVRSMGGAVLGPQRSESGPSFGSGPPSRGVGNLSLLPIIHGIAEEMKTNIPQGIADLTGGEYIVFGNAHGFDSALGGLANHAQNRYQLSFQASNPAPGPHKLEVYLARGIGARVVARTGYWPKPEERQLADPAAQ